MASKILNESVTSPDDGATWDFKCPGIQFSNCGDPKEGTFFTSTGWPSKKIAVARGAEHFDDHKGIASTSSLDEFRTKHGLGVTPDGRAVKLEEI